MEAVLIGIGIVIGLGVLWGIFLVIAGVVHTVGEEPKILLAALVILVDLGFIGGGIALGVHVGGVGGGIIIAVAVLLGFSLPGPIIENL